MGVIRWEDFYDGQPWTWGDLGSEPVCTIEVARVGNLECQTLEIGSGFPGKRASMALGAYCELSRSH